MAESDAASVGENSRWRGSSGLDSYSCCTAETLATSDLERHTFRQCPDLPHFPQTEFLAGQATRGWRLSPQKKHGGCEAAATEVSPAGEAAETALGSAHTAGDAYDSALRWACSSDRACWTACSSVRVAFSRSLVLVLELLNPLIKESRTNAARCSLAVTATKLQSPARLFKSRRNSSIVSSGFWCLVDKRCLA